MNGNARRLYRRADDDSLEIVPTVVAQPRHPEAIRLHDYWQGCRAQGGLRMGRDLPARAIATLMSKLSIFEPNEDRTDFRFRLAASGWLALYGRDVKGEWLSSIYDPSAFEHYRDGLRRVLETDAPVFTDVRVYRLRQVQHHIEYSGLPIEAPQGPCILIGAFRFE